MKRNIKKQNNSKRILFIALIVLILLISIILFSKTEKNNKINNIKQEHLGMNTTNIGELPFDITNQIANPPNKPLLSAGMIPIKYKNGNWYITTVDDSEWYNYANGNMANIMLSDGYYKSELEVGIKEEQLMQNNVGTSIAHLEDMGTIFTWVPKFAYNEHNEVLYLKTTSCIAGEYTTPEIFTYKASGVDRQDIALRGIWVEQKSTLGNVSTKMNSEQNSYGFIANTKAEYMLLDTNFINAINQSNETGIKNIESNKIILKVVNEKLTEPIMAELSAKGKKVTIKITKTDNGIREVRTTDGKLAEKISDTEFLYTVETGGLNKFIIIDNIGNQRLVEITVISPEIYVLTNTEDYVEFNGEKWYPYGTQVRIKYADNMSGKVGYYQEINGTYQNPVIWTNTSTTVNKDFTLTETMKYKAKIENSMGEILGEDEAIIHIMPTDTSVPSSYNGNIGGMYPVKVTGYVPTKTTFYGTETYLSSTKIQTSAVHMGLVNQSESKVLYIKIVPSPQGGYVGTSRNGVVTSAYAYNSNGYIFVTEEGREILIPKINEIKTQAEDNKLIVTVDAQNYNSKEEIEKYYYSLDYQTPIESDNNEYVFEDVGSYRNHTISVYVKDKYGMISQTVYSYPNRTSNNIPTPTIEIINEENIATVEYDGKVWYPYGTQIRINYAEDMTNLYGYYRTIIETTKEKSDWSKQINTSSYTVSLSETITYIAKTTDSTGKETEEVSRTIYILPNTYGLQNNYYQNIGEIYPIVVTGANTNYIIYGLDKYTYSSYIVKTAMHMGLVDINQTKTLYIKITDSSLEEYPAATRNGITSQRYDAGVSGYIFVTEDGAEIRHPEIESQTVTSAENSLNITINSTKKYVSNIDKYYYKIDNGEYVESSSNIYEFQDVQPYINHTITAYVTDEMGLASNEVIVSNVFTTKEIQAPIIEIINENNIQTVEFDGKVWYPYQTQVRVAYPNYGVEGLNTYMNAISDISGYMGTTTFDKNANSYIVTCTESGTIKSYMYDATGKQSEIKELHLNIMGKNGLVANYQKTLGAMYPVEVTGTNSGTIYGSDYYYIGNAIDKAATHMGLVDINETKILYVKLLEEPYENGFGAYTKNGITSTSWYNVANAFVFVTKDGEEIKGPKFISSSIVGGENEISVTVDFDFCNATGYKYYYSIANGEYVESDSNTYTFKYSEDNFELYKNNNIKVYAKDSNGAVSYEYYIGSGKTSNEIPVPSIEIVNEDTLNITEYNGKTWYPYSTQIKISFAEDMKNLTGMYKVVYEDSGVESGWATTNNTYITMSLSESMTIKAKIKDATNVEGEEASKTISNINIQPNNNGIQYANNVGEVYPVVVTGKTGTIYGSDLYYYGSNIDIAATHMGLVRVGETKQVLIKVVESPNTYKSTTRNKIKSNEINSTYNGYVFINEAGQEIKAPTISDANMENIEDKTRITVSAEGYNGASISKYYYSIDGGTTYEESTSNVWTAPNTVYSIKVYAKDSNGVYTEEKQITTLSGYTVMPSNTNYGFTPYMLNGVQTIRSNAPSNSEAKAYIELDLSKDYTSTDIVTVTLNARIDTYNNYNTRNNRICIYFNAN